MKPFIRQKIYGNIGTLFAPAIVGMARFLWWRYQACVRGPLSGFEFVFDVICPLAILAIGCSLAVLVLLVVVIRRTRSSMAPIILFLGIVLVFQIPLPDQPPTPEQRYFLDHRAKFEQIVHLAQTGESNENVKSLCLELFQSLEHVTERNCVWTYQSSEHGLSVIFEPFDLYHPLIYSEAYELDNPCMLFDPTARVEEQIDVHWYVCMIDWL